MGVACEPWLTLGSTPHHASGTGQIHSFSWWYFEVQGVRDSAVTGNGSQRRADEAEDAKERLEVLCVGELLFYPYPIAQAFPTVKLVIERAWYLPLGLSFMYKMEHPVSPYSFLAWSSVARAGL